MSSVHYQIDNNKIAHLILNKPDSAVNLMDLAFTKDLANTVEKMLTKDFCGVIMRSEKKTFFAGADIDMLAQASDENAQQLYDMSMSVKNTLRKLEINGKPVVACINGTALGGGFELALACHHRIAINDPSIQLGLPEVTLGLLPAGGGTTRMVRLLGLQNSIPYLTQGKLFKPAQGIKNGLINTLFDSEKALLPAATSWILSNPSITQPYDVKGYEMPGGIPSHPAMMQILPITPAVIRNATKGTLPAPEAILSAMVEGSQVDFDSACRIESRYFVELVRGQIFKNIINTFWYQQNEIKTGKNRPDGDKEKCKKVAILGSGMMGAGIAYSCAIKGIEVYLKDASLEGALKGKDYSRKILQKHLDKGRTTQEKMDQQLALIHCTEAVNDLADCDLVIEAVFEDRALKAKVTQEVENVIADSAIFGSNTSTLPITGLAQSSKRPANYIGIHFFSPVDKMPLVEIICGEATADNTLRKAYDFAQQLGKTPIVVNDSRGFYTSRVFKSFVKEGVSLLEEADAAEIENAAWLSGFPVGPLAVTDEVSLTLIDKIHQQTVKDMLEEGLPIESHPADSILEEMLVQKRTGKLAGKGFYDYPVGQSKRLCTDVTSQFKKSNKSIPLIDIKERLLFIMALDTVRCYEENVLRSVGDANIGAIFGIGYPQWTGGTLQYINQYGVNAFVKRAQQLTQLYGTRFLPTKKLVAMAASNEKF